MTVELPDSECFSYWGLKCCMLTLLTLLAVRVLQLLYVDMDTAKFISIVELSMMSGESSLHIASLPSVGELFTVWQLYRYFSCGQSGI